VRAESIAKALGCSLADLFGEGDLKAAAKAEAARLAKVEAAKAEAATKNGRERARPAGAAKLTAVK
jgi:hypothetical protein